MTSLNALMTAIVARITAAQAAGASAAALAGAAVLREDAHELATEIQKAIGKIGMLILVGQPTFDQEQSAFSPTAVLKIKLAIGIGEVPIIWRTPNSGRPSAQDTAVILTGLLHNLKVDGFVNLRVLGAKYMPDKKRQLYELTIETSAQTPPLPTP